MKKIIFFDLDNTLHSTNLKEIPSQTLKLMEKIANTPNMYLGLATGRGPKKIPMLEKYEHLFTYKVFINGAIAYKNNKRVYNNPLKIEDIEQVLSLVDDSKVTIGFVAENTEYVTQHSEEIDYGMKDFDLNLPEIKKDAYKHMDVYQLWIFAKDNKDVEKIAIQTRLLCYPWHNGGSDLVDPNTNKAFAIAKLLENETNYQLITVGDGHNDIKMIEMADIGIAMSNSRFTELKEKADYIAPHVDSNQLYDFFKKLNIID